MIRVQLRFKPDCGLAMVSAVLAQVLPGIIAPLLTVAGGELYGGVMTKSEIIVEVTEGS